MIFRFFIVWIFPFTVFCFSDFSLENSFSTFDGYIGFPALRKNGPKGFMPKMQILCQEEKIETKTPRKCYNCVTSPLVPGARDGAHQSSSIQQRERFRAACKTLFLFS